MVNKKRVIRSDYFVPAGIFLGLGVGFLINEVVAGVLIGLGVGFLAKALIK